MSDEPRLKVVLCWHMHQPQYRDMLSGRYELPWTYLHAIKDYVDMAAHLEAEPQACAVVNFAPILLEQLSDYAAQVRGFLSEGRPVQDPLLAQLGSAALPTDDNERLALLQACLRANAERLVDRFPDYRRLAELAQWLIAHPLMVGYADDQLLVDLLVWYHLAWMGETVRRSDVRVRRLQDKGGGFTMHDRRELISVIADLLSGLIDRYTALARQGRVELSVTPYAHPILPLLLDLGSAREAQPDAPLPSAGEYPGGKERARWHIQEAIDTFEEHFGFKPDGCWPAEGGVSEPALRLLEEFGFRWAATGESVLHHSLAREADRDTHSRERTLYRPYRIDGGKLACFFRDDGLSDQIGFTFSDWHADDAVANLVDSLERIAQSTRQHSDAVVSIILDGENAWEHYPENGYYFLSALYGRLASHPALELTTFSRYLSAGQTPRKLGRLVAGSWVYGTFSTWIGDADKNRGWDMLVEAKRAYDEVTASRHMDRDQLLAIQHQLSICEGSDWFWWFGDYNPADTVNDFDRLFRMHLSHLYHLLGREPPEYLSHSFTHGTGRPVHGGVMRHGQAQS
jgi:alpha-amylase/alpha-mannosidase (GH57 family)